MNKKDQSDLMRIACATGKCGPGLYQGEPGCQRCAALSATVRASLGKVLDNRDDQQVPMLFDGVHVRTLVRHDPLDPMWTMLTFDVYPLPAEVLPELVTYMGEKINKFLVDKKIISDAPVQNISTPHPNPGKLN